MTMPRAPNRAAERAGPQLWFGLLGGAAAWGAQFLAAYLISESACVAAAGGGGAGGAVLVVALLSLAAFGVAVAAALAGRRVWVREGEERGERAGGSAWTGLAGMLLSGVFAFVILVQTMPLFLGGGCA